MSPRPGRLLHFNDIISEQFMHFSCSLLFAVKLQRSSEKFSVSTISLNSKWNAWIFVSRYVRLRNSHCCDKERSCYSAFLSTFVIIQSEKLPLFSSLPTRVLCCVPPERKYFCNLLDFTLDNFNEWKILLHRGRPEHLRSEKHVDELASEEDSEETSVIVQLTNRVQDGTRCRPGSLDMCIQGKCQVRRPLITRTHPAVHEWMKCRTLSRRVPQN